ncbi:peroxisomal coenzyme A diphosphatase NUDT7 isoform X2 [Electrophorus electricus]|uniref:peroxisomal coenzyme A diphosphatase NUDT7 isoform X2 n=1 Tax=Electrophorus electricus TaxID=8005 RepID=UPI000F09A82C|nr:peroxisomal coenzyme A diphosphatase NUDT7 isoform X2 [Electrophorus electricus]
MDLKERVISSLKKHDVGDEFSYIRSLSKASVLIPIFVSERELHVLLTVRSTELKHNAGEVCFPGGKADPQDRDEIETALREAQEEIGLPPDGVEVRGLLVTPVVGFISESFRACPNPAEVSEVFCVPLEFFLKDDNHSSYPVPSIGSFTHSFIFTDPITGKVNQIWGLTAFLLIILAMLSLGKEPEFRMGFDMDKPAACLRRFLEQRLSKL